MTVRRVMVLAGAASAVLWIAPAIGGLVAVGLLGAGMVGAVIAIGLLMARGLDAVVEPTARPIGRPDRCRLCRDGRLVIGGVWVCPHCDFADPVERDALRRGESPAL